MDMYATFVGFFQEGGPFMYPIAIVLAIGVAIALERYFYLARQMRINRKDYNALLPLLKQRRVREIVDLTKKSASPMARIVADGVNKQGSASNDTFYWAENNGSGVFTIHNNIQNGDGDFLQGVAVGQFQPGGPTQTMLSWHQANRGIQQLETPDLPKNQTCQQSKIS